MSHRSKRHALGIGLTLVFAATGEAQGQTMPLRQEAAAGSAILSSSSPRTVTDLSKGWRFRFGGDDAAVVRGGYDDRAWQQVDVPHSWNHMGEYSLTRTTDANVRQGIGWYRLSVAAPAAAKDQRQVLQFDGVGMIAEVWVNGVRVGAHQGAFARFRFDVTDQWKPGATNLIVVKADNSKPEPGGSTENVIPLGGDFFIHGGIYRGVSLLTVDSAHIDLMDHGGPGVYISTPVVSADRADVAVRVRLNNQGKASRALTVHTAISDAAGKIVAHDDTAARLAKSGAVELSRTMVLEKPHLWQGRDDPYLYQVVTELRDGARVIDRVEQSLGVRSFAFDADRGFSLNGKPTRLFGASRHQDRQGQGWALSADDHAQDMAIMAEMGMNTIRHAHYQHAQQWADEADRTGMVVWAEIPFVQASSLTNGAPKPELVANAKSQLVELIRQNYNHPSIMLWSVGNESDIAAVVQRMDRGAQSLGMLQTLHEAAKQEDSSRPTAYADCCEKSPMAVPPRPQAQVLSNVADVTGYNRYYGWYYGQPADLGPALDDFHAQYPKMPIAVSEYGAGGAFTQHTDNPEGGPINPWGRPHPEEYQSWVHEESWKVLKARNYLSATWLWNMFDFASTMREEGEAIDLNDKGMVSYDRKSKKDAFYFYKANWSKEPVLHINGRRYIDRAYPVIDVRAYSNAATASLSLNGKSMGQVPCTDNICVWRNVSLKSGDNKAVVTATIGGQSLSDNANWTAPDAAMGIRIDTGTLTGGIASNGSRFGSDTFFTGGTAKALNALPFRRGKTQEAKAVTGTADGAMMESYREGAFRYDIPLPKGRWTITLHMFEPDSAKADNRLFDVLADGKPVLKAFNPAKAAGGVLKAVTRTFPVMVKGDHVSLEFSSKTGDALVSMITATPG